jgi:hypothetical protein
LYAWHAYLPGIGTQTAGRGHGSGAIHEGSIVGEPAVRTDMVFGTREIRLRGIPAGP